MKIDIEYDGTYPNLCSGTLQVTIEGSKIEGANKCWVFPRHSLSSQGSIERDGDWNMWSNEGDWEISSFPENFPKELEKAVLEEVNETIPHGCCGGCI